MKFTKASVAPKRVEKASHTGALYYERFLDENGLEYVQIVDNVGGGGASVGSFSGNLYRVDHIGIISKIEGYDQFTESWKPTNDNNMKAFLEVIKIDVIEDRKSKELEAKDNPTDEAT